MRKGTGNTKEIPIGTFGGAAICFKAAEGAYAAVVANYTDVNVEVLIEDVGGKSFEPLKVNAHDWTGLTSDGDDALIIKQIEGKNYSVRKAMAKLSKFMASLIAEQFLDDMNPTKWDGTGIKPLSFREQIWEYPLSGGLHLEIVYVFDEQWKCCCDIASGSESIGARTVCKINSKQDIAGAIYDLCQQKNKKLEEQRWETNGLR